MQDNNYPVNYKVRQAPSLKYNDLSILNGTNFLQVSFGKRISLAGKK